MSVASDPDDLAIHGVRILGFADAARVAARFGLDRARPRRRPRRSWRASGRLGRVRDALLDAEAYGWVSRTSFAGGRAWVDAPNRDSCHLVWIRLHEDLLATLGLPRGSDA